MKKKTFITYLKNPMALIIRIGATNFLSCLSDEAYLKFAYKVFIHQKLNLENPRRFNEKIQWLKLNDKNPNYVSLVDKAEVKKYVIDKIGKQYVIPTLKILDSIDELDLNELPDKFVIKCTHDSGGVIVCRDKNGIDLEKIKKKISRCLKRNYFFVGREKPYKSLKPRILIEKIIDAGNDELLDYKFMCFGGNVKCSFVCTERFSDEGLKVTFFDREWKKMPFERHYPSSDKDIPKPQNYEEMIRICEDLSEGIPFVRIDLYNVEGHIYFGEMTFYPGSGFEEFNPDKYDFVLGEWIDLSLVNKHD